MDRIETNQKSFADTLVLANSKKQKIAKNLINYAGLLIGVFLVFAVIVITTTDISITAEGLATLSLDFVLLLFCSYLMYISAADSGMRKALLSDIYKNALSRFEELKKKLVEKKLQTRLYEFCQYYIQNELKNSQMRELLSVGFSYEDYEKVWRNLDKNKIEESIVLTTAQKTALIKANSYKPITLTPEMILRQGRDCFSREPLGKSPRQKKYFHFYSKFFTTIIISIIMSVVVLSETTESAWVIFTSCMVKLLSVVVNGFTGYKYGYENIVVDTVNYMDDQCDLIEQAMQYFDNNPPI